MQNNQQTLTESPCNGKCVINPKTNFCDGCFRTIDEIICWMRFTDEQKSCILKKVETRKSTYLGSNKKIE